MQRRGDPSTLRTYDKKIHQSGEKRKTATLHVAPVYIVMMYTGATVLQAPVRATLEEPLAESTASSSSRNALPKPLCQTENCWTHLRL